VPASGDVLPTYCTSGKRITSRKSGDSQRRSDDDQHCPSAAERDGDTVIPEQDGSHYTHDGREHDGGRRLVKVHESWVESAVPPVTCKQMGREVGAHGGWFDPRIRLRTAYVQLFAVSPSSVSRARHFCRDINFRDPPSARRRPQPRRQRGVRRARGSIGTHADAGRASTYPRPGMVSTSAGKWTGDTAGRAFG